MAENIELDHFVVRIVEGSSESVCVGVYGRCRLSRQYLFVYPHLVEIKYMEYSKVPLYVQQFCFEFDDWKSRFVLQEQKRELQAIVNNTKGILGPDLPRGR